MDQIKTGQNVLLLWGSASNPDTLKPTVEAVRIKVGSTAQVQVEHSERLEQGNTVPKYLKI